MTSTRDTVVRFELPATTPHRPATASLLTPMKKNGLSGGDTTSSLPLERTRLAWND
jgi:hypothetical protein